MNNPEAFEEAKKKDVKTFTNAQRAAIAYSGKGILLCAGAGSGKTATLTEKVCRIVCDENSGADISRMIIVTFTKLAANELRERIAKALTDKLKENPSSKFLANQLVALECAQISTIDSFFLKLIKPYFSVLGLPPKFRIIESATDAMMKEQIMEDIIDDYFESGDEKFIHLADSLSGSRDEKSLGETILTIEADMTQKGYETEKLIEWANAVTGDDINEFFSCPHGQVLKELVVSVAEHYIATFSYIAECLESEPFIKEKYSVTVTAAIEYAKMLLDSTERGYEAVSAALQAYSLPKFNKLNADEKTDVSRYAADTKSDLTKSVKYLNGFFLEESQTTAEIRQRTADICVSLSQIIGEFRARYEGEKKEKGLVNYSDLGRYAHRLFCNPDGTATEAAKEFSNEYDYIFIDEYQDTNDIQDEIFAAISCNMKQRFMVGDVKQSIYGFRGGEPAVFSGYRRSWENVAPEALSDVENGINTNEMCVFMSENFRSDKSVIDYVNCVSDFIFKSTPTQFEEADKLICKRKRGENDENFPVEVCIVEKPVKSGKDASEDEDSEVTPDSSNVEAEYVAEKISKLIESGKRANGEAIRPKDIALLFEYRTHMSEYADALLRRGIPVKSSSSENFFGQGEVLLVLCILNAVDNPLRDIYVAGAMKSPVFGFTMDDMIKLSIGKGATPLWFCVCDYCENGTDASLREKCVSFCDTVTKFRVLSKGMSAAELLRNLYDSLSLFSLTGSSAKNASSSSVRRNLNTLYEYARSFEEDSFGGLSGFIKYINELMEKGGDNKAELSDADAVSIITIHGSKGLEFPVCFLCECATLFNFKGTEKSVLFNADIGLGLKLRDSTGLVLCETPLRKITAEKNKSDMVYEQMRVLYVALTRAVERLVITLKSDNPEKSLAEAKIRSEFITSYERNKLHSFSAMLLPATVKAMREYPDFAKISVVLPSETGFTVQNISGESEEKEEWRDMSEIYRERLSFSYPFDHLKRVPSKVTVSKLRPALLDEDEITLSFDENKTAKDGDKEKTDKRPVPRFILKEDKAKPTDIGTATHVFLQFCDFERLRDEGFDAELARLVEKRFITEEMASLVSRDQIEAFASSELFASILVSGEVRREFRFNVSLPASSFTNNEELKEKLTSGNTQVIAQGVIDLVYTDEEGRLILVDYKTDSLSEYELTHRKAAEEKLISRHKTQLTYYAKACEKMFGRPVDRVSVFSLALGDSISVL